MIQKFMWHLCDHNAHQNYSILLVINSTLLQASTKVADWRSVIPLLARVEVVS